MKVNELISKLAYLNEYAKHPCVEHAIEAVKVLQEIAENGGIPNYGTNAEWCRKKANSFFDSLEAK